MVTLKINESITLIRVCDSTILHLEDGYVKHCTSDDIYCYISLSKDIDMDSINKFFNQ